MVVSTRFYVGSAILALAVPAILIGVGRSSDHADTPEIAAAPGRDLTDVYIFPSPTDSSRVVLAMNVHPLIGPGQGGNVSFDPNVLYQFKIDNSGDSVEDLVIQARFEGHGRHQRVIVTGPTRPKRTDSINSVVDGPRARGTINQIFSGHDKMQVFAGAREDSFFFDLEQFFNILPDRATPLNGMPVANPNDPQQTSWRPEGEAVDFLSNGGYNVLSIVVELPKKSLRRGHGESVIGLWATTNYNVSNESGSAFRQVDRLARPAVNEVFATVANNRHKVNDETQPSQDFSELANDIQGFMTFPAGRSQAITNVVKAVLVPDVLKANLDGHGAAYLGYETNGATGGTFGGRALNDDVIDISLGIIFGNTVPALGLAPDDGKEIPSLTSDHVGPGGKHFTPHFPYLGSPR